MALMLRRPGTSIASWLPSSPKRAAPFSAGWSRPAARRSLRPVIVHSPSARKAPWGRERSTRTSSPSSCAVRRSASSCSTWRKRPSATGASSAPSCWALCAAAEYCHSAGRPSRRPSSTAELRVKEKSWRRSKMRIDEPSWATADSRVRRMPNCRLRCRHGRARRVCSPCSIESVELLPSPAQPTVLEGARRTIDYQDPALTPLSSWIAWNPSPRSRLAYRAGRQLARIDRSDCAESRLVDDLRRHDSCRGSENPGLALPRELRDEIRRKPVSCSESRNSVKPRVEEIAGTLSPAALGRPAARDHAV